MATGIAQNVGIARLLALATDAGGTPYNAPPTAPVARVGVGTNDTAPTAADGTILGTAVWRVCDTGYPTIVGNSLVFQATFVAGTIVPTVKEVACDNGSAAHEALIRAVLSVLEQFTPLVTEIPRIRIEIPFQ